MCLMVGPEAPSQIFLLFHATDSYCHLEHKVIFHLVRI